MARGRGAAAHRPVRWADPGPRRRLGDELLWAGNLRFNVLEPERDFFYPGVYFGARKVLAFGVAAQHQRRAVATSAGPTDYTAIAADVFLDLPVGADQEVVAQAAFVRYEEGSRSSGTGHGWFAEALYRYGPGAAVLSYERFAGDRPGSDCETWRPGAAYYFDGNTTALKGEIALERDARGQPVSLDRVPTRAIGTLQLQLFL